MNATSVLDCEFLEMRCRLIDLAASLDRIDRAEPPASQDPRKSLLQDAIMLLADRSPNRAGRMQMHFSDPYDPKWAQKFGLPKA